MPSDYTRKSVGHVLQQPDPEHEFYVFVARYWPRGYEPKIGDNGCVFNRWDTQLAPSPRLLKEYDPEEPWAEWARQYVAEVGEATIHRQAATHAEDAGDRTVVFVCYEGEDEKPRCHTWTILSVLKGQQQTALADFLQLETADADEQDKEEANDTDDGGPCLHGHEWCPGPDGPTLPCFGCFDPAKVYDGRR